MRKLLVLFFVFFCNVAVAQQITTNWLSEDGTNILTSTCTVGGNVTLPNKIQSKYGHVFSGFVDNFTPVQYIESLGAQWIDPGLTVTYRSRIKIKFYIVNATSGTGFFGRRKGSSDLYCGFNGTKNLYCIVGGSSVTSPVTLAAGDMVELDFTSAAMNYLINGTAYNVGFNNYYSFSSLIPIFLVDSVSNMNKMAEIRLYYFQIYDDGVLVRDFIPVTDSDGTPCLFDRVAKKFYYNKGVGNFVAGPAIQ